MKNAMVYDRYGGGVHYVRNDNRDHDWPGDAVEAWCGYGVLHPTEVRTFEDVVALRTYDLGQTELADYLCEECVLLFVSSS